MPRGRFLPPIHLSSTEADELTSLARSRSYPFSIVQRAQIVLACADGHTNKAVAARLDVSPRTVSKWRQRFVTQGVAGLHDATRPGRRREIDDERVMALLNHTVQHTPDDATHWSTRRMAQQAGVSHMTVQRIWSAFAVAPHRQRHFKLSTDPYFAEKCVMSSGYISTRRIKRLHLTFFIHAEHQRFIRRVLIMYKAQQGRYLAQQ